jgi:hypothetical protein
MEAVRRFEHCGVLVATLDHLSSFLPVREAIQVEITRAGGRLLTVAAPGPVAHAEQQR